MIEGELAMVDDTGSTEHAPLRTALERISPLALPAWEALATLIAVREAARGVHVLRAGEPATHIFFVNRGLLREYYADAAGQEFTRRFCDAGDFSGSLADLLVSRGALVSIQVLEPSELLVMPWSAIETLAECEPSLAKLLRRFAELLYIRKIEREFEMLTLAAGERYRRFVAAQPGIHARLPRHLVASYLGITPVHLSRIASAAGLRTARATQAGRK